MIKIKYIGNKAVIDERGVSFDSKHDKYVYIEPAIHILDMVYSLNEGKITDKITLKLNLTQKEIFSILYRSMPNFDELHDKKIEQYKQHLLDKEQNSKKQINLTQEEKDAYYSNLKIMREYNIQRATNKIVYEEIINSIVKIILEKKVAKIVVFYNEQFLHAIESIETTLAREKAAPRTEIKILADGRPHIEFFIYF